MIKTGRGKGIRTAGGAVRRASSRAAGQPVSQAIVGNFQSYGAYGAAYQAYTGMWGVYVPTNSGLVSSSDMLIFPDEWPNNTTINWNVTPDARYSSGQVSGYLSVIYGNYSGGSAQITPRQVKNIAALDVDIDWTFTGATTNGLLSECWLTTLPHQTGGHVKADGTTSDQIFEIGFFPRCSPASQAFAAGLTLVGTFVDSFGVSWRVGNGGGSVPYLVATRVGYVDHRGKLPYRDLLRFLMTKGVITGNEYFNGLAFGVEPQLGAASLVVKKFVPNYS